MKKIPESVKWVVTISAVLLAGYAGIYLGNHMIITYK
jgi:hypothetical protein